NSTVAYNVADDGAGGDASGGGLYIRNQFGQTATDHMGTVTIVGSTISNNSSDGTGGMYFSALEQVDIFSSTIADNRGGEDTGQSGYGGGLQVRTSPTVTPVQLQNTIIADNTLGASGSTVPSDILGTVESTSSHNLIGSGGAGGLSDNDANGNLVLLAIEAS